MTTCQVRSLSGNVVVVRSIVRAPFRIVVVAAGLSASSACGDGYTFGIAPGPGDVDAGPPPVVHDAGPAPDAGPPPDAGPEPDAGANCTTTTVPLTADEDEAAFTSAGLGSQFACASCHTGGSDAPEKRAGDWGTPGGGDWFTASQVLADQPDQVGIAIEQSSLYQHFTNINAMHSADNTTAQAGVQTWIAARRAGTEVTVCVDAGPSAEADAGGGGGAQDAGPQAEPDAGPQIDCTPVERPAAEQQAKLDQLGLDDAFNTCASCHFNRNPNGSGGNWGATTLDLAGWYTACKALADKEPAVAVDQTSLYRHFNGINGMHPLNEAARDDTAEWLDYIRTLQKPPGCP